MRVSVSVGKYGEKPYHVPGLEADVYSMEELCYCIRENACLLDTAFMSDGLLDWIEEQCGLKDLAKKLHPLVHRQGTLSAFAAAVLEYTGFYPEEVIRETAQALKQGAGLSLVERKKKQADFLVENKRYRLGIKAYDLLLERLQENGGETAAGAECPGAQDFLARLWNNKGVAFAGLMLYESAADCFRKAYELEAEEAYGMHYLAAKRMLLSEEAYPAFAAENKELYQCSLRLEERMKQHVQEWESQPDYLRLYGMQETRDSGQRQRYLEDSERLIQAMKDSYRKCQRSKE